MAKTDLPWTFLGRRIKPFALAVAFATFVVSVAMTLNLAVGALLDGWQGDVVAIAGYTSVALLFWGWWGRSCQGLVNGLLVTTGVWATVTSIIAYETGFGVNTLLAFAWVIASGGSYLLEKTTGGASLE